MRRIRLNEVELITQEHRASISRNRNQMWDMITESVQNSMKSSNLNA